MGGHPGKAAETGILRGHLRNAVNGHNLQGCTVEIRRGGHTVASFSAGGSFQHTLPIGDYTVHITHPDYIALDEVVHVQAGGHFELPLPLSPKLNGKKARIVLTWGPHPRDLDTHMKTPTGCHMYYGKKTAMTTLFLLMWMTPVGM